MIKYLTYKGNIFKNRFHVSVVCLEIGWNPGGWIRHSRSSAVVQHCQRGPSQAYAWSHKYIYKYIFTHTFTKVFPRPSLCWVSSSTCSALAFPQTEKEERGRTTDCESKECERDRNNRDCRRLAAVQWRSITQSQIPLTECSSVALSKDLLEDCELSKWEQRTHSHQRIFELKCPVFSSFCSLCNTFYTCEKYSSGAELSLCITVPFVKSHCLSDSAPKLSVLFVFLARHRIRHASRSCRRL